MWNLLAGIQNLVPQPIQKAIQGSFLGQLLGPKPSSQPASQPTNPNPIYQGPVPAGYDEAAYRKTGKLVPLPPAPAPVQSYGGYYDPSKDIISNALRKLTDLYSKLGSYKPASFDEALARQSVTQQEDQFYTSKINDFLKGIDLARTQSAQSEQTTLQQLTAGSERYQAGEAQQYDIAKNDALNGVVGSGRQLSGFGGRQLGQQAALHQTSLNNFLAGVQEQKQNTEQNYQQGLARLNLNQQQQIGGYDPTKGIGTLGGEYGRQRALDVEQGVANRQSEFTQQELQKQQLYNQGIQAQIGGLSGLLSGAGY